MSGSAEFSASPDHRLVYHRALDDLDRAVLQLGALVTETVSMGTKVLLGGDLQAAQSLAEAEDAIDALALSIEDMSCSLIARQAPKAEDLRHLLTIIKLVHELERSADLMVNVSKAARRMYGSPMSPRIRGLITSMSHEATKLLRLAIDAYADHDAALGSALGDIDDTLDQFNTDMVAAIFAAHSADQIDLGAAVQVALIARYYERVGDHAVNIGERVTYMVTGWLPEHSGVARHERRMGLGPGFDDDLDLPGIDGLRPGDERSDPRDVM